VASAVNGGEIEMASANQYGGGQWRIKIMAWRNGGSIMA